MGYAKYKEDVEKIYSANIFGTFLDFQQSTPVTVARCPYCSWETLGKEELQAHILTAHKEAAVFIEFKDRIIPEKMALYVRPATLKLRCPSIHTGVDVTLVTPKGKRTIHLKDGNIFRLQPADNESNLVIVSIGAFTRQFAVSFRRRITTARITNYLLERIEILNSCLEAWDWPQFHQIEGELRNEPGLTPDDARHREGVYHYYFGLWLENARRQEYALHLEQANELLQEFDDPLSQLISSYFLYRVNQFDQISRFLPFPLLLRALDFLTGKNFGSSGDGSSETTIDVFPIEILIGKADEKLFGCVDLMNSGDYGHALIELEQAKQFVSVGDSQTADKITFAAFQCHVGLRRDLEARRLATELAHSCHEHFRSVAQQYLRTP